jgi:protein-L-isoaspartate(D-aspartate) O-methyltransferase
MTSLLALQGDENILEIGTGSGYQAAILSYLGRTVHTVERHAALAKEAQYRLYSLGLDNVIVHEGDGSLGWPEEAPYQAVLVTAAAPTLPVVWVTNSTSGGGSSFRSVHAENRSCSSGSARAGVWIMKVSFPSHLSHCVARMAGATKSGLEDE